MTSYFDRFYRRLLVSRFFAKGWGKPDTLKRLLEFRKFLSNRDLCYNLVSPQHPVTIEQEWQSGECLLLEGSFSSPLVQYLPGVLPRESEIAKFQVVIPMSQKRVQRPMCIHLAGTGDHGYWRRRTLMAKPLAKEAELSSLLLENPYYGSRKPKEQRGSSLQNVTDLFAMGAALILESLVLLHWCTRQGFAPLGITGMSMGGHMASCAATNWPKPLSLIPCISGTTASHSFTQGVLGGAVSWSELQNQYKLDKSFSAEIRRLLNDQGIASGGAEALQQKAFAIGRQFASFTDEHAAVLDAASSGSRLARRRGHPMVYHRPVELIRTWLRSLPSDAEIVQFMQGVMDECTHLAHFTKPVDVQLVVAVVARLDAYVPPRRLIPFEELWPGCEVRYVDHGHVAAYLLDQSVFRKAIVDSFNLHLHKYYHNE